jgi:glutamyl-tRNA reductase
MNFLKDNVNNAFVLCNRTFETAVELEQLFNCKAYTLNKLKESLQQSDIVISATSAPHYIIKPDAIPPDHPLVIFDLAVPQDVDPNVTAMPNVHYYSILEIEKQVNQNIAGRMEEIEKANIIVEEEVRRFLKNEKRHQKHLMLIHAQQERSLTIYDQILTT